MFLLLYVPIKQTIRATYWINKLILDISKNNTLSQSFELIQYFERYREDEICIIYRLIDMNELIAIGRFLNESTQNNVT